MSLDTSIEKLYAKVALQVYVQYGKCVMSSNKNSIYVYFSLCPNHLFLAETLENRFP